jgi:hypothetical protein
MEFTIAFVGELMRLVGYFLPLFIAPSLVIICLALWIGKQEKWGKGDSIYFGFITATTVGYGDILDDDPLLDELNCEQGNPLSPGPVCGPL